MDTIHDIDSMRRCTATWRAEGRRVGFVPTMGNLHAGHLRLVEEARSRAERVVVSVFVNPLQFGPSEDFDTYPRTLAEDSAKLERLGVDVLFAPAESQMYPWGREAATRVEVPALSDILCGASRPGFFVGVATVVAKLFNIVAPHVTIFGEKDFQQLLVIRRMVADLNLDLEVVGVPTVREPDGLAMSSRNGYLSEAERGIAPALYRTLESVRDRLLAGERDFDALEADASRRLDGAGLRPDYVSIRRSEDLGSPEARDKALIVLAAAWLGGARLIDNLRV